jgi:hypothetical protein
VALYIPRCVAATRSFSSRLTCPVRDRFRAV